MKRKVVCIVLVCLCTLFLPSYSVFAQSAGKSGGERQKKQGGSKIVIEYVSFPDILKRYQVYPWETPAIEEFKKAYGEMVAPNSSEEWIRSLSGTGNKNKMVHVLKKQLVMIAFCKPHFCDMNQMLILFDPLPRKCYAINAMNGKFDYLGLPDDEMRNVLKILLVDEYKEIYKGQ